MEQIEILERSVNAYVHENMVIECGSEKEGWNLENSRMLGGSEVTRVLLLVSGSLDDRSAPIE